MNNIFKVKVNEYLPAKVEIFKFSGGESQIKFHNPSTSDEGNRVNIFALIRDGDIMELALLVDAIRRSIKNPIINLHMPYLPYARQDRVMNSGESLAVKVFCDFVNSLNLNSVKVDDCHSDVGVALLNNATNDQTFIPEILDLNFDVLVAPDAGALKKTCKYANILNKPVIRADKERDVKTGNIAGTVVYGDVEGKRVLIIDDCADGGRTFIELAKVLYAKGAKEVTLYVTHGLFSYGKQVLYDAGIKVLSKYDWTEM